MITKTLMLEKKISDTIDKKIHHICLLEAVICLVSMAMMYYRSDLLAILICVVLYLAFLAVQKKQGMLATIRYLT
jgi:hypothetical protein